MLQGSGGSGDRKGLREGEWWHHHRSIDRPAGWQGLIPARTRGLWFCSGVGTRSPGGPGSYREASASLVKGAVGARPSGRSVRGVGWSRGVWQQGMITLSVGAAALCNRRKGLQQKGSQHAQHRRGRAAAGRYAFFSKKGLKVEPGRIDKTGKGKKTPEDRDPTGNRYTPYPPRTTGGSQQRNDSPQDQRSKKNKPARMPP